VEIISALNGVAVCRVVQEDSTAQTVRYSRVRQGVLNTRCTCSAVLHDPLCFHKVVGLIKLREQFGNQAFEVMRDWTSEKNSLLATYGFSVEDDLEGKFDFRVNDAGELGLIVLDAGIHSPDYLARWWKHQARGLEVRSLSLKVPVVSEEALKTRALVYVLLRADSLLLPDVSLVVLTARCGDESGKLTHVAKLDGLGSSLDVPEITETDSRIISMARVSFNMGSVTQAVRDSGQLLARTYYNHIPLHDLSEGGVKVAQTYLGSVWNQLWTLLEGKLVFTSMDSTFAAGSLVPVRLQTEQVSPYFQLYEEGDFIILQSYIDIGQEKVRTSRFLVFGFWFLVFGDSLVKLARYNDAVILSQMGAEGLLKVRRRFLRAFLVDFVMPLTDYYSVDFNIDMEVQSLSLEVADVQFLLREDDQNLLILPVFRYVSPAESGILLEFYIDGKRDRIWYQDERLVVWCRDQVFEAEILAWIRSLHPLFAHQGILSFFHLPFSLVTERQWLFGFVDACREKGVQLVGFDQLKRFRYNPNKPSVKVKASSGIDWFDMRLEVVFGEQRVSLAELKRAIMNRQAHIQLPDGTLGLLADEWIAQYSGLFKFGQVKGEDIRVSKIHFSVLDMLYDSIDSERVQHEIWDKKQKLLNFKEIKEVKLPANITVNLREYQREGFKWLNFLDEFKWGGCLADDMGLGKTVQVLIFLQHRKNLNPRSMNLVVVPTTLLFNWQAEVAKFAAGLRVYVHRGIGRERMLRGLEGFDIVLTTYGTLRSDIEVFRQQHFDYVILDESQAIKNPDSKIAKAVKLLDSGNRLVMTGTPVENNTFDLYSQMDFLNPGLLGTQEFFRAEYATPIDKFRDEERARQLRQLVYPFMLKRTKEEVAKDLPDKVEVTLYCEMGKEQRDIYETYRALYRNRIVDKMSEDGKEKASFLILEGLLKLRQICDSPYLVSDDWQSNTASAKLEELVREIEENAGNHKILIFSQFLKMLDLIRQYLDRASIPYEYLDGSTQDRAARVKNFQESIHCRVFLMSLKAGGVGINLTEADYVYLVDPWWNPAVEQQAIDRAHRIGQEKKVFAYRMICKDTVEEKIMQLQERKKLIARDLISTEEGLIKKLSQDDIINLFT
jgi:non-specific serine/threonine protein kinase